MSDSNGQTRRGFIQTTAAGALAFGLAPLSRALANEGSKDASRGILHLRLHTRKLALLRAFYVEKLECPILEESKESITFGAGGTKITFTSVDAGDPYYHFAFNIPENKLALSKDWIRPRSAILKRPDGSEEYFFPSWNANSIYFNDPAGNILEFIARHNLKNADSGPFSAKDILYASEIALVVDDVVATASASKAELGLSPFGGAPSADFSAVGDDHRLLIIVKKGRAWNSGHGRVAEVYPTNALLFGERKGRLAPPTHPYEVLQQTR
ncbi:MAG: twin-arginine translocation signal domain-containing protein [Planctomycetes bacterium]|nr:twin-arginine translocation signal domain-containing protein [Planctomycetota bacterium]